MKKKIICALLMLNIGSVMGMQKSYEELANENKQLSEENLLVKESIEFLRQENRQLKEKLQKVNSDLKELDPEHSNLKKISNNSYSETNRFKKLQEEKLKDVKEENTKLRQKVKELEKNNPVSPTPSLNKLNQKAVTPWYYRKDVLGAAGTGLLGLGYLGGYYMKNKSK